ncbi:SAM-dependent methyltransferase, partial [Methanocaldococcus villosus KIN24-T80]
MNYITPELAKKILNSKGEIYLNLDLNKTNKKFKVIVNEDKAIFPSGEIEIKILKKIAKDNAVYLLDNNRLYKLAIADESGYYKLVPTIPPTIEINGIRMHRTKGINPYEDTLNKVNSINIKKGDVVLDTCMGLGYTAIEAYRRGAKVITIEK